MNRQQRLRSAKDTDWVNKFEGKRIVRAYRKHFGVDIFCAITELRMLGVEISREYEEQARGTAHGTKQARKAGKAQLRESDPVDVPPESDERFAFIAGYTSGGVPYGVTWEDWEEMEEKPPSLEGAGSDEDSF
jgi:hypothetical protein